VALVGASLFASLQMWSGVVVSRWTSVASGMEGLELLLAWMVPPLVAFALALWGGWLGTSAGVGASATLAELYARKAGAGPVGTAAPTADTGLYL